MFKVVVCQYKHISFCLSHWCRRHRWFCCHPEIMCYHGNVRSYFSSLLNFLRKLIFLLLRNVVLIPTVISLLRAFKFLTFIIPRNASHVLLVIKYHIFTTIIWPFLALIISPVELLSKNANQTALTDQDAWIETNSPLTLIHFLNYHSPFM